MMLLAYIKLTSVNNNKKNDHFFNNIKSAHIKRIYKNIGNAKIAKMACSNSINLLVKTGALLRPSCARHS